MYFNLIVYLNLHPGAGLCVHLAVCVDPPTWLLAQVRDHSQAILCLSPTQDADRLLTASKDNQLRLWDFRQLGTVQVGGSGRGLAALAVSEAGVGADSSGCVHRSGFPSMPSSGLADDQPVHHGIWCLQRFATMPQCRRTSS